MDQQSEGIVYKLAESLGSADAAVRLILSLLAGYPLAFAYRLFVHGKSPTAQHLFFIATGLALGYFNFGLTTVHSLANTVLVWLLIRLLGGSASGVVAAFILNNVYLLIGYFNMTTDGYDISWTIPHCVITLRLTGTMFDLYDGRKKESELSVDQKKTALYQSPSLLELLGHVYYFGGFLVGPTFNMKRYLSFVNGEYTEQKGPPNNLYEAGKRLLAGVWYIATFQAMSSLFFTDQYMLSQQFHNLSFLAKCAYILVWGKLNISKYVGVWLIGEGSCILTGLTYNGKDKNGNVLWDGCSNAHIYTFESSATFRELISGFNVNTNNWMARYIFKRLRFLGNVQISQVVTLLYLAVWHGLHSGYYMNFFLEFIMINGETQLAGVIRQFPGLQAILSGALLRPLVWFVKKTLLLFFVGYALVSFVHLKWSRYSQVYGSVYYVGHVIFLVLPFLCLLVRLLVRSPSKRDTNGASVKEPADDKKTS